MEIREGLTFDDVLLIPRYSEVESRSKVDLSINLFSKPVLLYSNSTKTVEHGFPFKHPIIPANMKSITEFEMAREIWKSGGLAVLHRFMEPEKQLEIMQKLDQEHGRTIWVHVGMSVGIKQEDYKNVDMFVKNGAEILCVDIAHGDSKLCVDMCNYISEKYPDTLLIAGNVATGEAAARLWRAGADFVKVGVGPGSLCTTRIETGNGVPQLTALMEVSQTKYYLTHEMVDYDQFMNTDYNKFQTKPAEITRPIGIIADGGVKNAGDCVKALCFADMVMAGNIFAGARETPGKTVMIDGMQYKEYVGSSTHKANHVEGVAALVPQKEYTKDILMKLLEGISSGCSYQGAADLEELKKNAKFVRITNAGLKESHPHDVIVKG